MARSLSADACSARRRSAIGAAALALLLAGACRRAPDPAAEVVARFSEGSITAGELTREVNRLPPALRTQFDSIAGRRELAGALVDKRLLFEEARRRKFLADPELRRQVEELEQRLAIQALLAEEERRSGAPSDAEAHAWFEVHRAAFAQAERARLIRIYAELPAGAGERERGQARERLRRLAERLRAREDAAKVAAEGDGPEHLRGGDIGFVERGRSNDAALEQVAFALQRPGDVSPPFPAARGLAVVMLVERIPAREPSFEEIRGELLNRMQPETKRKVFDKLIQRLRTDADVQIAIGATRH